MPITTIQTDETALTMTVVGDYPVSVERLWQAYEDPRQIEQFWGPPEWPATFTRHDMKAGGESAYYMKGPDGTEAHGYWKFVSVDPGRGFEVEDGFADSEGNPNDEMPNMRMVFEFHSTDTGSQIRSVTYFPSKEAMDKLVEMGMIEGLRGAMGKLDGVLAAEPASANR